MKEVSPGDVVFSFAKTIIPVMGTITSYCYESPKPHEFTGVGDNWDEIGWKVNVSYITLSNQIRPRNHIQEIRPTLP